MVKARVDVSVEFENSINIFFAQILLYTTKQPSVLLCADGCDDMTLRSFSHDAAQLFTGSV